MKTSLARAQSSKTLKDKILTLGFQADTALMERVDREAERSNVSRSDVLRWAVLAWLQQKDTEREIGVR